MQRVYGEITKDGIKTECGHELIITEIKKAVSAKNLNKFQGWCRKKRGKKQFSFCVKHDGLVLLTM